MQQERLHDPGLEGGADQHVEGFHHAVEARLRRPADLKQGTLGTIRGTLGSTQGMWGTIEGT
jgi:hypothetical protein